MPISELIEIRKKISLLLTYMFETGISGHLQSEFATIHNDLTIIIAKLERIEI